MTSKACFSKPAGFFRQLTAKQLWLFALWSVFLLFLYPLSGMMEFSDGWEYTALYDLQRQVDRSFLTRTTAVLYMMPVLAIVFSSCFGYLNSRQKLDFYHAQPVTRTRLFFTNYASGAFHFAVPYLVMHTLAFVLMNSVTGFYQPELRLLLYPMLYTLGMFFIFYSLMVLFRMVCGNTVIAVLSYGFMTNLPAIAYFLYQVYVGRWSNLYMSSAATESGMRLTSYTLLEPPMSVKVEPSGGVRLRHGHRLDGAGRLGRRGAGRGCGRGAAVQGPPVGKGGQRGRGARRAAGHQVSAGRVRVAAGRHLLRGFDRPRLRLGDHRLSAVRPAGVYVRQRAGEV